MKSYIPLCAALLATLIVWISYCLYRSSKHNTPHVIHEGYDGSTLNNAARKNILEQGINTKGFNMTILPDTKGMEVAFRGIHDSDLPDGYKVKGYIMVIAQFDKNLVDSGNLTIRLSNEMKIESTEENNVKAPPTSNTKDLDKTIEGSMCNEEGVCKYTFKNLYPRNPQTQDLYYYRLGVGIVYYDPEGNEVISRIVPYGFGKGGKQEYFRIDIDTDAQELLLKRLEAMESRQAMTGLQDLSLDEMGNKTNSSSSEDVGMEAYMRMLRPHLGNYPNEFLMSNKQIQDASLEKYLQESLAVGSLDVNVAIPDIVNDTS